MNCTHVWHLPENCGRADGGPRHLGVEIEVQGTDFAGVASAVARALSSKAEALTDADYVVRTADHGDFHIELDNDFVKRTAEADRRHEASDFDLLAAAVLRRIGHPFVPMEVVTPPLPLADAPELLDPIIRELRKLGVSGTRRSLLYALGLHFNVEPVDLEADTIRRHLQAFVVLYDWLVWRSDVDVTRWITPYVDPFPGSYVRRIASPDYAPSMSQLIDDYLADNATRNRALDMLPMFSHIDPGRVRRAVRDPRVKPRPTFHYRLANSDIDQVDWNAANPWNDWMVIETLANDPPTLAELIERFTDEARDIFARLTGDWTSTLDKWIQDRYAWL